MKKNRLFLLLIVGVLALLTACGGQSNSSGSTNNGGNASTEVKLIRAGTTLGPDHSVHKGLVKFKELVEERTGGSIVVETYHSASLGDDRTMSEALQLGTQEVTTPATASLVGFVPELSIFDFPFLFPNEEVASKVLNGEVGQKLLDKLESQNLVGLAFLEMGFRNLTNDLHPVATAEDWKGLTIRVMPNELYIDTFKALGANPTPLAFPELFTAMQQGTVDSQEGLYSVVYDGKFQQVQKYISNTQHTYSPFIFMMGKPFYDSLTAEEQEIVRTAAKEAAVYVRELNKENDQRMLEELIADGMVYTEVTPEDRAEMAEVVKPVVEKYKEKYGAELVEEVINAIEEAQK